MNNEDEQRIRKNTKESKAEQFKKPHSAEYTDLPPTWALLVFFIPLLAAIGSLILAFGFPSIRLSESSECRNAKLNYNYVQGLANDAGAKYGNNHQITRDNQVLADYTRNSVKRECR
jgi:hypothetical protein